MTQRQPINLPREAKLGLALLGTGALVGTWLLFTNKPEEAVIIDNPPPVSTPAPSTTPAPDAASKAGTQVPKATSGNTVKVPSNPVTSGGSTPVNANPTAPVQVAVVPPLNLGTPGQKAPKPVPAKANGINPDKPLATLSGNPFKPLELDKQATASAAPSAPVSTPVSTTTVRAPAPTPPVTISIGGNGGITTARDTLGSRGGAASVSPLPGTATPVVVTPVKPIKTASGATVTITPPTIKVPTPSPSRTGGVFPKPTIPGANVGGSASTAAATPPVAGVNTPGVNHSPGASSASATSSAVTASSAPARVPSSGSSPQVITELGQSSPAQSTPSVSALDTFLQSRQMALNGVVLGTVNTAIFRSNGGFVVLTAGQTVPDSEVVVKEVTATTATLALGNNVKILELDKR